ncbi:hypothetical protein HMPREF0973_01314 [Prevotella veroralis F0319]|uniref:Uncharacterized protein n=1 Tax=Prevotella veroralis F0319 TaxID=649761 RepID=C9MNX6_9BACT|nr:hypothetical protein HMPREF0973_01314 [Prevotella veroralis F0319]
MGCKGTARSWNKQIKLTISQASWEIKYEYYRQKTYIHQIYTDDLLFLL